MKQLEKSRSATYNLGYHIIFCTKYRRKVLTENVETRLKELIHIVATENDWTIATLEVIAPQRRTVGEPAGSCSRVREGYAHG
jgi:putative transposase